MKKYFYRLGIITIILAFLTGISSCKKLIEIPSNPPSELAPNQVFADSTNVMSAVAAVYVYQAGGSYGFAFQNGLLAELTGLTSDELNIGNPGDVSDQFFYNAVLTNNAYNSQLWQNIYTDIYQVNACITGIQNSTGISSSLKKQLLGEMYVVRALYYFNLANLWGEVPLVATTDYKVNGNLARSSVNSIYAQINSDLIDAQQKLKNTYPSPGRVRPNLYTALTLFAKLNLYMQQWQNSFDAADKVIKSGLYSLESSPNNVFIDGSKEAIWAIPANSANYATQEAVNYLPQGDGVIPSFPLTSTLVNSFEVGDQRFQDWVGTQIVNINGIDTTYYYPFKYKNISPYQPTIEDLVIFRLAEIYLIRAEAEAHLNNLTGALADLNMVRTRAGLPKSGALTQSGILSAVMHERQVELFSEWGNRFFDLKRTTTINAVLGSEKTAWKPNAALYPIPFSEIQLDNKLTQNPGY